MKKSDSKHDKTLIAVISLLIVVVVSSLIAGVWGYYNSSDYKLKESNKHLADAYTDVISGAQNSSSAVDTGDKISDSELQQYMTESQKELVQKSSETDKELKDTQSQIAETENNS
ncbi:hypothetical protein [Caproicibacterium amylolyticum]|uniref:Uncharacterized protein n=1 Tax=Caproicibacterium amylolyticum TaxID=2766537 RepID=A0A7G9WJI5_9FIRM|nr:hypothetical protein [Caproicibacterium amylolyticum]QNO18847.1 hypothetical protein H6X83_04220 [Caproicibacterium amylolyticum]